MTPFFINDPEVFRPEPFLEGSKERQSWFPFSVGPRQRPGQNYAQYELRTLATMLLRCCGWGLPEGSMHADGIKNALSTFALTLPQDLDITFKLLEGQRRQ
ncbi:hypothetical protein F5I97DRAFT_1111109 [Phlebopus sp. FC_14]|nr:hypothetical protein F5I97DRAFT_1111109 [Phlebopus sp. FC_14]